MRKSADSRGEDLCWDDEGGQVWTKVEEELLREKEG